MKYSAFVDTIALAGKCAVEGSALKQNDKEWAKLSIEGVQTLLKAMQSMHPKGMTAMDNAWEEIALIKEAAHCYRLKRVVLFPMNVNGQVCSFLRMYQGDIDAFCMRLGLTRYSDNVFTSDGTAVEEYIRKYGVIVYDRD